MKGTFSELELSLLRQRSLEALRLKASRGDLHTTVAIGYLRSADDRIEMDPDRRIREALILVFRRFEEAGSIRQVTLSLQQDRIDLPHLANGSSGRIVEWRPARYTRVFHVLTNPVYAGAYAYGRTTFTAKVQDGKKVIKSKDLRRPEQWNVLIREHHEGYISWDHYERNQRMIASNASMRGSTVQGAARNGSAILVGLLRCGHCGRKLSVQYSGNGRVGRYTCRDQIGSRVAVTTCISFGNMRIDAAVSAEVIKLLSPLAMDAALEAIDDRHRTSTALLGQTELMLQQAQYEADRARRQYDAIDPENRLVAGELERRWNERLENVARIEEQLRARRVETAPALDSTERTELLALATDLPRLWNHPAASLTTRKRLLRALVEEIVVCVEPGRLLLKLHWKGGDHTALEVPKNRWGQHRWKTSTATAELIRDLHACCPTKA
jgi:hypothetical protein